MRKRRIIIPVLVIGVALITARAVMPSMVRSYVNSRLADMGEYSGHVADVDLALWRGAYTLKALVIDKVGGATETSFLELPSMDISLDWGALFSGELVGQIEAYGPRLNLIQAEDEEETQLGSGVNWPDEIRELFPFRFNRVDVYGGHADFLAPGIASDDALRISDLRLALRNLTNINEEDVDAFAELEFTGRFMESAPVEVFGQIDPNKDQPTFDLNFTLEGADVTAVNPWLDEFLNVDAETGTFSLYSEFAAAEGRFVGYARPIIEDVEIYRSGEEAAGPFRRFWEALVDFGRNVVENEQTDAVATQIPIEGELQDPDAGILVAVVNVLRNGFIAAFAHALEGSIDLKDVDPDAEPPD